MGQFTVQLQQFADKTKANLDLIVARTVGETATRLDERSPVGDATYWASPPPKGYVGGRFRGNWQLGTDSAPSGETGRIDADGSETVGAILAEIPAEAAGKVYYLFNGSPYAQRLEEGWSRQAPVGLVGITATEFPQIVEQAAGGVQ